MTAFVPFEEVVPVRVMAPNGVELMGRAFGVHRGVVRIGLPAAPGLPFAVRTGECVDRQHRGYRLHPDDLPRIRHHTPDDARCWAIFDADDPVARTYRYQLGRDWGRPGDRPLVYVMLNPSVAGGEGDMGDGKGNGADDPTIRKCKGFAVRAGYRRVVVVNLFAFIATDPAELLHAADPVGPANDHHIVEAVVQAGAVVVAWGQLTTKCAALRPRACAVLRMLAEAGVPPLCIGTNGDGTPVHPLMVPYARTFRPFGTDVLVHKPEPLELET
jgi:hypothetical protein